MSLNGDGIPMNMPVVPAGTNSGNGWGGFGGDNGWWIILFFIVLMGIEPEWGGQAARRGGVVRGGATLGGARAMG